MSQIIFLVGPEAEPSPHYSLCNWIHQQYSERRRILVNCNSQPLVEELDEALFTFDNHKFVPHNIVGEGPLANPPVQVSLNEIPADHRDIIVNLTGIMIENPSLYKTVSEIVPLDKKMRENSRLVFRNYRKKGYNPSTLNIE